MPERSITEAANYFNKSVGKIFEILKTYKYKSYKFHPVLGITENNKRQRLEFRLDMVRRLQADNNFLDNTIFTDEATFTTNGLFNRKNKHYWSTTNPHQIQEVRIQGRKSVNVWCGVVRNRIVGPIFIRGHLTGERYLYLLENQIENHLEALPVQMYNRLIWQQDGAPAHNVQPVRMFLNNKYNLWI